MLRSSIRSLIDEMYDPQNSVESMLGLEFEDDDAWDKWLNASSENIIQTLLCYMFDAGELDGDIAPVLALEGLEMPAMLEMPVPPEEDEDDEDLEDENQ
jgi:hypothetical protein